MALNAFKGGKSPGRAVADQTVDQTGILNYSNAYNTSYL